MNEGTLHTSFNFSLRRLGQNIEFFFPQNERLFGKNNLSPTVRNPAVHFCSLREKKQQLKEWLRLLQIYMVLHCTHKHRRFCSLCSLSWQKQLRGNGLLLQLQLWTPSLHTTEDKYTQPATKGNRYWNDFTFTRQTFYILLCLTYFTKKCIKKLHFYLKIDFQNNSPHNTAAQNDTQQDVGHTPSLFS